MIIYIISYHIYIMTLKQALKNVSVPFQMVKWSYMTLHRTEENCIM